MRNNQVHLHFLKVLLLAAGLSACGSTAPEEILPRQYADKTLFLSAIKQSDAAALKQKVTGIAVPHHLLAKDLIAETVALASGNAYDRILLLTPDHFFKGKTDISVSTQSFDTVFGTLRADATVAKALEGLPNVSPGSFFASEHGANAVIPFLKYHFPDAKISVISFQGFGSKDELRTVADRLLPLVTDSTLIVQSTDYSHFLSAEDAKKKDQETLRVIAGAHPDAVLDLDQPEHLDAKEAQWLHMTVQAERWNAKPTVIRNKNSIEYAGGDVTETTSYVTQVYAPEPIAFASSDSYVFAGDTMLGRGMRDFARDAAKRDAFVKNVLTLTGGAPMIVNLEGVMMEHCPPTDDPWVICMETNDALAVLKALRVIGVSLANNHAMDFGKTAYQDMVRELQRNGIRIIGRGEYADFERFRLFGFTDIDNSPEPKRDLLYRSDMDAAFQVAPGSGLPLFAFLHWGDEYSEDFDARQDILRSELLEKGIELIVGSHSHRSSRLRCDRSSCVVPSLGNFLFDQKGSHVSGHMLKVTFFPQGTYSVTELPLE